MSDVAGWAPFRVMVVALEVDEEIVDGSGVLVRSTTEVTARGVDGEIRWRCLTAEAPRLTQKLLIAITAHEDDR